MRKQAVRSLCLAHLASNDVRIIKGRHKDLLLLQSSLLKGNDSFRLAEHFLSLTICYTQSAQQRTWHTSAHRHTADS